MRITGGRLRGLTLATVGKGDPKAALRPTPDRVRESLFSILTHGPWGDVIEDARTLDLFAGTGALGLEALSRGAAHATFIDKGRAARALILQNIERARAEADTRFLFRDATRFGPADAPGASLVFCDPPYGKGLGGKALSAARAAGWIEEGALAILEDRARAEAPEGFRLEETRSYGDTTLTFLVAE
jgi:16S rRNA (guanine966-N2)-methyltransferase